MRSSSIVVLWRIWKSAPDHCCWDHKKHHDTMDVDADVDVADADEEDSDLWNW